MRWPWVISIYSHEMIVNALTSQLAEIKAERSILLDRLATIGLGGPLFSLPTSQDSSPSTEPEEELTDPQEEIDRIMAMSKRPTTMVKAIRRLAIEEIKKRAMGPDVAWIPRQAEAVTAKLDAVEAAARKKQA